MMVFIGVSYLSGVIGMRDATSGGFVLLGLMEF
jgi:hypothetical protein